jgi:hypothetical protein
MTGGLLALDHNPLDLVEADLVGGPVVELRGARRFMRRYLPAAWSLRRTGLLRVFQCAAVLNPQMTQMATDPRREKCGSLPAEAAAKVGRSSS